MKKWLSLVLSIVLLLQACPLEALAAGNALTESELQSAWRLSGQDAEVPRWHEGMLPEANWNAEQLDQWLDHVLSNALRSVQEAHSDVRKTLARINAKSPDAYQSLTASEGKAYFEYMSNTADQVEAMREQLRMYRDLFIMRGDRIASLVEMLRDDTLRDRERIRYSDELRRAVGEVTEARAAVVKDCEAWLRQIDAWHMDFAGYGDSNARDALGDDAAGLSDWLDRVTDWREEPVRATVTSSLHASGTNNSVLARLSPARSALACGDQVPGEGRVDVREEVGGAGADAQRHQVVGCDLDELRRGRAAVLGDSYSISAHTRGWGLQNHLYPKNSTVST